MRKGVERVGVTVRIWSQLNPQAEMLMLTSCARSALIVGSRSFHLVRSGNHRHRHSYARGVLHRFHSQLNKYVLSPRFSPFPACSSHLERKLLFLNQTSLSKPFSPTLSPISPLPSNLPCHLPSTSSADAVTTARKRPRRSETHSSQVLRPSRVRSPRSLMSREVSLLGAGK
jgi:hypothetical protein